MSGRIDQNEYLREQTTNIEILLDLLPFLHKRRLRAYRAPTGDRELAIARSKVRELFGEEHHVAVSDVHQEDPVVFSAAVAVASTPEWGAAPGHGGVRFRRKGNLTSIPTRPPKKNKTTIHRLFPLLIHSSYYEASVSFLIASAPRDFFDFLLFGCWRGQFLVLICKKMSSSKSCMVVKGIGTSITVYVQSITSEVGCADWSTKLQVLSFTS